MTKVIVDTSVYDRINKAMNWDTGLGQEATGAA